MDEPQFICIDCIGDSYLQAQIEDDSNIELCDYCAENARSVTLLSLAKKVDQVYRAHYRLGEYCPTFYGERDRPDYRQKGDSPEEIITEMIKASYEEVANDICNLLDGMESWDVGKDGAEAMYDFSSCYQHITMGAGYHHSLWDDFCEDIKHGTRFFSLDAKSKLNKVFANISDYSSFAGKKVIREISGIPIYRARKANTLAEIEKVTSQPAVELAAPPKNLAVNGRMNPIGVSIFYGAFDRDTCIAELRPAVGETIVCGEFKEAKQLRVFDFTMLNNVTALSMFDPCYAEKHSQLMFLRDFESIISKAFLPSDTDLEYLPLQAMAEYLARFVAGGVEGIIFPSAQRAGAAKNIVVFDHHNRAKMHKSVTNKEDAMTPYLKFVEDSISVHKIEAVEYQESVVPLPVFFADLLEA
ncbi:MAG: hypothetical protein ACI8WB_003501 [Phenylobacterium sp.]|jgi:hypothetical protein